MGLRLLNSSSLAGKYVICIPKAVQLVARSFLNHIKAGLSSKLA